MSEGIRLVLVDDHPMVRVGVRAYLEQQLGFEVVGEAGGAKEGLALVAELAPDVVLLDILMPDKNGIELAREIKHVSPTTKIIALTSSDEEQHVLQMVSAGAAAYLMKDVDPKVLAATVRSVAAGEVVIEPRIAALMVRSLQTPVQSPAESKESPLTTRELEVLRFVAHGMTNGEIAARLVVSDKTIKTHVSNILAKLQLSDRTQAAVYAWKQGILDVHIGQSE